MKQGLQDCSPIPLSQKPPWQHLSSNPSRDFHWPAGSTVTGTWCKCRLNIDSQRLQDPPKRLVVGNPWQGVADIANSSLRCHQTLCSNSELWIPLQDFLRHTVHVAANILCLSCLSSIRTHMSSARLRTRHKNLLSLLILSYPGRHCAPLPNFGYISKKLSTDLKQPTQWINPSHFGLTSLATPDSASTFAHGDSSKHIDAGAQHWLASGSCDASESWESSEPSTFTA